MKYPSVRLSPTMQFDVLYELRQKHLVPRPRTPPEPHMCAECEDNVEGEIVLDTARGRFHRSTCMC